ncbi:MAG: hypothetical protein MUE42_01900 [Opitutaceae bacterium]|nr:hypothetical protein [Opitutaceae bacterium]
MREILRELHAGRIDRAGLAGFAREVREAAATDAVAAACVREAGEELLRLAEAVRGRLAPRGTAEHAGFPLAVTGGLGMGEVIRARAAAAGFAPMEPLGEPVAGAALLAARAAGVELDAGARVRLLDACKTKG